MNIIEILSEYKIEHRTEGHEHCRAGWVQIDCPFCSSGSERFRMGINIKYAYANCWHCGHKSLSYVLIKLLKVPAKIAKDIVGSIPQERRIEKPEHEGHYQEPAYVNKMTHSHKYYLQERGFDSKKIEQLWQVRGIGLSPELQWRLFIPIIHHGDYVSWTTRTISHNPNIKGKYISAEPENETIPHKHLIYGEDYCRHAIVIVEGPIDVWAGGPGFGAVFGLSYTSQQVERISKYPVRAICLDNEPEAQKVARRLVKDLSAFPGETYNIVLDSKDAGEAKQKEIKHIRREILE